MTVAAILQVPPQVLSAIAEHCAATYPQEACGLLIGTGPAVSRAAPLANVWDAAHERGRRFLLDPLEQLRFERSLDGTTERVMGSFHSHPDHPAEPSRFDAEAAWPGYWYVIVPVAGGAAGRARAWTLDAATGAFIEGKIAGDPL
jgi:proteasome lid subunit RPN8/RPN11